MYTEYVKNSEWLLEGGPLVESQYDTLDYKPRILKKTVVMLQIDDTDDSTIVGVYTLNT